MTRAPSFVLASVAAAVLVAAPRASAQTADPARTADAAFVAKAADVMSVDTELATLAATRTKSPAIRTLARSVLDARAAIARDLATMADTRQIATPPQPERPTPAATPDTPARPAVALRAQPPGAFDGAFLAALAANAETAVALFEAESRDGRDDEIKEWAARQLPALREHLTAIRTLRPRPGS